MKNCIFILLITLCMSDALATVYTVNATTWSNTGAGTSGDLRYCIAQANADATAGPHEIRFAAGGTGLIQVTTTPTISNATQRIIINGETAPGWSCGNPVVVLEYIGGWALNQFNLSGSGGILRGLIIQGFSPRLTAGTSEIYGCWFNLSTTGNAASTTADAMGSNFMYVSGGTNHIIGSNDCNRNVFGMTGLAIFQGVVTITAGNGTTFNGNYFGTNKTGLAKISNFNTGTGIIRVEGAVSNLTLSNNVIGGAGGGTGRAIVTTAVAMPGLTISGNKIGLDANGNVLAGYGCDNGGIVFVGGTGSGITISNNDIGCNGAASFDFYSCGIYSAASFSNVTISGNYIGVTRAFADAGNAFAGIYVSAALNTVSLTNNVIGFNGQCCGTKSHGWELSSCTNVTATDNYVGVSPGSLDIGNGNSGMVFSACSNVTLTNNFVCNNEGRRPDIPNGGIVISGGNNFTIQNNSIGVAPNNTGAGQLNIGGNADGGSGMFIENGALRVRVGGMGASQQNKVAYSAANGIELKGAATDFIEMRWNSIYCNTEKGINLNAQANNNLAAPTITGPNPNPPTTISGTKPANTVVDVFGTVTCASVCNVNPQGQLYYGEATSYASGTAGTAWTYAPGGDILNYITALATGVTGTSNCTALGIATCRTSEFSNCEDNILPVEFISVNATYQANGSVQVRWKTATENNNHYFVVTRSNNGNEFTAIGVVDANGNTSTLSEYAFEDPMPYTGTTYYRIKQVDRDGSAGFSPVASASSEFNLIRMYPNPALEAVTVESSENMEHATLVMYDVMGKTVKSISLNSFKTELSVSELPAGPYFIQVSSSKGVIVESLYKK